MLANVLPFAVEQECLVTSPIQRLACVASRGRIQVSISFVWDGCSSFLDSEVIVRDQINFGVVLDFGSFHVLLDSFPRFCCCCSSIYLGQEGFICFRLSHYVSLMKLNNRCACWFCFSYVILLDPYGLSREGVDEQGKPVFRKID